MILVIDDTPASADAIARTLRETGREAHIASTVPDALAALAADTPLCVVLDLVLGADATPLHTALTRRRLPVLLVSGVDPQRLPAVAEPRGWRWLAKPVEPDALVTAVAALVGVSTGEHRVSQTPDAPSGASKSTAQVIADTLVDVVALAILGAVLLVVRPANPWVQGGCVVGLLLLAGVRVADLVAVAKGLPARGGPAALLLGALAPLLAARANNT